MNDINFENIADNSEVNSLHEEMIHNQRGWRRAMAVNAVQLARSHARKSDNDHYSAEESDILVMIMELLDKVSAL